MIPGTVTAPRLDADGYPYRTFGVEKREQICRLIRAGGYNPNLTTVIEYDVIDGPLLRLTLARLDDQERPMYACEYDYPCGQHPDDERCFHLSTYDVEIALREPLPDWWQPNLALRDGPDQRETA